ncbi:hypothetical protein D3C76_1163320 [compost metagenome]
MRIDNLLPYLIYTLSPEVAYVIVSFKFLDVIASDMCIFIMNNRGRIVNYDIFLRHPISN